MVTHATHLEKRKTQSNTQSHTSERNARKFKTQTRANSIQGDTYRTLQNWIASWRCRLNRMYTDDESWNAAAAAALVQKQRKIIFSSLDCNCRWNAKKLYIVNTILYTYTHWIKKKSSMRIPRKGTPFRVMSICKVDDIMLPYTLPTCCGAVNCRAKYRIISMHTHNTLYTS